MTQQWYPGVAYGPGSRVVYQGIVYHIIQPHTSQSDWAPNIVPALWGAEGPESSYSVEQQCPGVQQYAPPQSDYVAPQQPPVAPAHSAEQPYQVQPDAYVAPVAAAPEPVAEPYVEPVQEVQEEKHHFYESKAFKIGAGILGGALAVGAVGLGAYGISQHLKQKHQHEWKAEAEAETQKYANMSEFEKPAAYWALTTGANVPAGAYEGGSETNGKKYYVSRVWHEKGLYVGKVDTVNVGGAAYGVENGEHTTTEYEILMANPSKVRWIDVDGCAETALKSQGLKAVEGGHTKNGKEVYIAKADVDGNVIPGYAVDGAAHCSYAGQEFKKTQYKVLVYA